MSRTDEEPRKLSTNDVARRENVSARTIRRMCERGELPAYKVGKQWRIDSSYKKHLTGAAAA